MQSQRGAVNRVAAQDAEQREQLGDSLYTDRRFNGYTGTLDDTYGNEHQRARQSISGTAGATTLYYGGAIEKEITSSGTRIKTYMPMGIGYLEESTASPIAQGRYFRKDHLGSTGVITNESGAVLDRLSYDAWGNRRNADGTDDATYALKSSQDRTGYTGEEHLEEVGLVHLNGRVYDPLLGRFTSADPTVPDPTDAQALNRYAYVLNSPLNFTDPTGLNPVILLHAVRIGELYQFGAGYIDKWGNYVYVPPPGVGDKLSQSQVGRLVARILDGDREQVGQARSLLQLAQWPGAGMMASNEGPTPQMLQRVEVTGIFDFVINLPGTAWGDAAAEYYAQQKLRTGNELYGIPLAFAVLWTPSTAFKTASTLAGIGGLRAISAALRFSAAAKQEDSAQTAFKTSHYADRFNGASVSVSRAESAVGKEIEAMRDSLVVNADVRGRTVVDNVLIEFRARLLPDGIVNVGTIFPVK